MLKSNNRLDKKQNKIYLDYAAGALPNAGSIHLSGVEAKDVLIDSRKQVASVLGALPKDIVFTGGGTEGNNLAIQGLVLSYQNKKPHIITTNIEHSSVLQTFKLLESRKLAEITIVPVETNGIVDSKKIKKAIKKNTILVSVNYVNSEIGTIQPIREIIKEIRHWRKSSKNQFPFFHVDAVQAVNYLDINVERLGVDLMTFSGAKIFNSGRVGVLYKRNTVKLSPLYGGGDQEYGLRPGTENVQGVKLFADAFVTAQKNKEKESKRLTKLRDYFIKKLKNLDQDIVINGDEKNRLPNNVNITIPNIPSDLLVIELSAKGIMTSAKSACKSGDGKASYVIKAINKNLKETDGSIRFSMGLNTKKEDIDKTLGALKLILQKLKKWYS